ncbi:MAG: PAS domain-containing protein [Candidatus Omnitrophica bacterium]|nr:PAS domain-containing protein [Candidatus Omnitrophota bacterium]
MKPASPLTQSADLTGQLRDTLGKLELVMGTIDEAIVCADAQGRIQWCNAAFDRLASRPHLELLGADLIGVLPLRQSGKSPALGEHPLKRALADETAAAGCYEVDLRGERRWLDFSVRRMALSRESIVVVVIRDVTERERQERLRREQAEALERGNAQLQRQHEVMYSLLEDLQQAKDRLETQQRQLQATNARLEEMTSLKDEFVAKVSHELRSPLTAIKEGISLTLDEVLGPINAEQRDFLSTVDENIDRLAELINNMLDLSKIEAGRMRLMRQRLDLRELIHNTMASYRLLAGHRTIDAQFVEVPAVFADSNRVLQVLGNLFSNAIKFTKDDGTIAFSLRHQDGEVAVSIHDDGIGIPKGEVSKLFQKFSQVGEGENRPKGTGLGLALCKELIELHRGTITVESDSGRGSTFTFTLPVFTQELALRESFRELVELSHGQQPVALLALETQPILQALASDPSATVATRLDQVAAFVQKHLQRSDVVLSMEPRWVLILAMADEEGVRAISERVGKALREWDVLVSTLPMESARFGVASYPADGAEAARLFAKATDAACQPAVRR